MMFFKVSAAVYPPPNISFSMSTSESIVGVFGVSNSSSAGVVLASPGAILVTIASTFAANPHFGHRT
ncbi:unannotated protein [freshwater metagenome]|uniref:Unannotated protein n=1 Tax=freshwater metagenome TaxID=449393 RepID=A0A6J7TDJ3_9ZZZZ